MALQNWLHMPLEQKYVRFNGPKLFTRWDGLTLRQQEIAQLVSEGNSSKHIARLLGISPETVRKHRHHIYKKLSINSVADIVKVLIQIEKIYTPTE